MSVSSKVQALTIHVRIFGHPAIATETEALPSPPHLPLGQLVIDIAVRSLVQCDRVPRARHLTFAERGRTLL